MKTMVAILMIVLTNQSDALEQYSFTEKQQACYATAMIGYDYVINSRVGLPIEHALNTVSVSMSASNIHNIYKTELKNIVSHAYQWRGDPHIYAVKVLYECAYSDGIKSYS